MAKIKCKVVSTCIIGNARVYPGTEIEIEEKDFNDLVFEKIKEEKAAEFKKPEPKGPAKKDESVI